MFVDLLALQAAALQREAGNETDTTQNEMEWNVEWNVIMWVRKIAKLISHCHSETIQNEAK